MEGLEPPHLTASDPKSDVSTNFTTSGRKFQIPIRRFLRFEFLDYSFGAANVVHFRLRKCLFFTKFVDHGNRCAATKVQPE